MNPIKAIYDIADKAEEMIDNIEVTEMHVDIFKNGFLPYFTGEKEHPNVIAKWIEVAGGANRPVKLVDDDGNLLDVVPPIFGTHINNKSTSNLDTVMRKAELQNKHFPGAGDRVLKEELNKTIANSGSSRELSEWSLILDKYSNKKDEVVEDNSSDDDGIEIEY